MKGEYQMWNCPHCGYSEIRYDWVCPKCGWKKGDENFTSDVPRTWTERIC